eukprot:scaffold55221_cov38-Phaeocystis_antarctica.AAC.1
MSEMFRLTLSPILVVVCNLRVQVVLQCNSELNSELCLPTRLVLFSTPRLMPCVHGWPGFDPHSVALRALRPLRAL